MEPDLEAIQPAEVEFDGLRPRAPSFADHYFGSENGVGERTAVFLEGNRLAARFSTLADDQQFIVGELGFGTGLNALLTARLFDDTAPSGARLSIISAEKHPLRPDDLRRAQSAWPELRSWREPLQRQYPAAVPGFHRITLSARIDLILMFGEAQAMWDLQPMPVDAWFLDGFAPARNPSMWSGGMFEKLAGRTRPGATLATFSAAGAVRRGLIEAGFAVERRPGFGGKRHRLVGAYPGAWRARTIRTGTACIVGAGLAGSTTARALAERGWRVDVVDRCGLASGASGNRAGVVYTTPSGVATPQNRFYQSSYLAALRWIAERGAEARGLAQMDGVVQHVTGERQRKKLVSATDNGIWPHALMHWLDDSRVFLPGGGVVRPPAWCRNLLDDPAIAFRRRGIEGPVREIADAGSYDVLVVCTGASGHAIEEVSRLPLRRIRGQVTDCVATTASARWRHAECHDRYVTPAIDGVHCVGATFDLRDHDPRPRDGDDARNLASLRARFPDHWRDLGGPEIEIAGRRVGFRCQSPDFLPVAGPLAATCETTEGPELWVNVAHGSRGLSGTPLVAEMIADRLSGLAWATDTNLARALDPGRFADRVRE